MSTENKNGILGLFSQNEEKTTPYKGEFRFTPFAITFRGTSILSKNVSQFEKYGLKRIYKLTIAHLVLLGAAGIGCLFSGMTYLFIPGLAFLAIVAYCIWLRFQPKDYGLTIELNSGSRHYFISKDEKGIDQLFELITTAIEMDRPQEITATFSDNRVTINIEENNGKVYAGDDYSRTETFN